MAHQVLKLLQQKPQQCGAIKQLNLFNKYLLLVTFETDDNDSIRNGKNTIRTALINSLLTCVCKIENRSFWLVHTSHFVFVKACVGWISSIMVLSRSWCSMSWVGVLAEAYVDFLWSWTVFDLSFQPLSSIQLCVFSCKLLSAVERVDTAQIIVLSNCPNLVKDHAVCGWQTKHNPEKANDAKYSITKLTWFTRLIRHLARNQGGFFYCTPEPTRGRSLLCTIHFF